MISLYIFAAFVAGVLVEGIVRSIQGRYPTAKEIAQSFLDVEFPKVIIPQQIAKNTEDHFKDPHGDQTTGESIVRRIMLDNEPKIVTLNSDLAYNKLREIELDPENVGKRIRYYLNDNIFIDTIINASSIQ